MIPKSLSDISLEDIQALLDNVVPESKTIEYKSELPHEGDSKKIPFLAEVCAFANAAGGDLIYGIKESKGIPISIPGVQVDDLDKEILRLETAIQNGIEPRIIGVASKAVELSLSTYVLIIRVERSWNAPHRVSYKDHAKFYGRNSGGKYPLDVTELRAAFTFSELVPERIRRFREDRVTSIMTDSNLPAPLIRGGKIALHVIPLSAFTSHNSNIIAPKSEYSQYFSPLGAHGWNHMLNIDGVVTYHSSRKDILTYAQVFRSGIIETVVVLEKYEDGKRYLPSVWYEREIIKSCQMYISNLGRFEIYPPLYILLSFINMSGFNLHSESIFFSGSRELDREIVLFPEIVIENTGDDLSLTLRPLFDMVWNAFGCERSLNYADNGRWKG